MIIEDKRCKKTVLLMDMPASSPFEYHNEKYIKCILNTGLFNGLEPSLRNKIPVLNVRTGYISELDQMTSVHPLEHAKMVIE